MIAKPVESLALAALTMAAAPPFMSTPDWYTLQGVMLGTALAALGPGDWQQRILRATVSLIVGYMAGQWVAEALGQTTQVGFRFVAGCVSFTSWWIVMAIEKAAPSASRKLVKASVDGIIGRIPGVGLGSRTTDRAADIYMAVEQDKNNGSQKNKGEDQDG